jgi:amino acid adenylation domain-containing protein
MHPFDPVAVVQRSVVTHGSRPALKIGALEWSYERLWEEALKYAGWCDRNVPSNGRVCIYGEKLPATYAAILGTLISGRSYVPIHPEHPPARWQQMMQLAEVKHGFVTPKSIHKVEQLNMVFTSDPGDQKSSSLVDVNDDAEAYVMFTSGSTGGPKGVPVGRWQVGSYLQHQLSRYDFTPEDRFTQLFALTFDLSVHDLFVCWGSGACLCVPEVDDPLRIPKFIKQEGITVWFSVPSVIHMLQRMRALQPAAFPSIRLSFFCGESLSIEHVRAWKLAVSRGSIVNLYGPTEATIAITAHEVSVDDDQVPIGRIFEGHEALVETDHDGRFAASGEGGLIVVGPQVNSCYLKDDDATSKAFFNHNDARAYRTGDRVRIDADGVIHFLGRQDQQVKIQGYRVEPQEIDVVLARDLNVSAVTIPMEENGTTRLVTFLEGEADETSIFTLLRRTLPAYMIPDRIVHVPHFPYNTHGKLDRKALLAMS